MPVSDVDRFLFDLRGYLVVRDVLDPDAVAALSDPVEEWGSAQKTEEERGKIEALFDWGQGFVDLIDHELTLPYITEFVDEGARLDNAYAIYMVDGDHGLPLHGGVADGKAPWIPTSTTWYGVDQQRITSGLTKVCWALTDLTGDIGGFCCIPGSHRGRFAPPGLVCEEAIRDGYAEAVELRAGDAIVFTEALVHGWRPWTKPSSCQVLIYKYVPGYARYLGQEWLPDELTKLTPRQQLLVQPPYVRDHEHVKRRPIP